MMLKYVHCLELRVNQFLGRCFLFKAIDDG